MVFNKESFLILRKFCQNIIMAIRRKKKVKEDETLIDVVEVKQSAQDFFENNKSLVLIGLTLLVLLVVGYIAYKYAYKAPRENAAMNELYKAETQFERDSFTLALENPGGGFSGLLDIIDTYGGTKAANTAKYYAGVSYLQLGRFEDAIEYLDGFRPKGDVTPIMKHGAMGDAYSELGQMDAAINAYKAAANAKDNDFLTPYYLSKYATLLNIEGRKDEALKAFERIRDEYPQSAEFPGAKTYIQRLNS